MWALSFGNRAFVSMNKSLRKCRRCGVLKPKDRFVDVSGQSNPRGGFCVDCHFVRLAEWQANAKAEKESKLRKLKIIYGDWWRHYCLPREFAGDIYEERDFCLYCGNKLPPMYLGANSDHGPFRGRAHLDHMDPLELGGEDSIRNVVYVCDNCNYKKGARSFVQWLALLNRKYQKLSREVYAEKHGHQPEEFKPGEPTPRCDGVYYELDLSEERLREIYPKPIVNGPPETYELRISVSIEKDENGKFRFKPKISKS